MIVPITALISPGLSFFFWFLLLLQAFDRYEWKNAQRQLLGKSVDFLPWVQPMK